MSPYNLDEAKSSARKMKQAYIVVCSLTIIALLVVIFCLLHR